MDFPLNFISSGKTPVSISTLIILPVVHLDDLLFLDSIIVFSISSLEIGNVSSLSIFIVSVGLMSVSEDSSGRACSGIAQILRAPVLATHYAFLKICKIFLIIFFSIISIRILSIIHLGFLFLSLSSISALMCLSLYQ